LSWDIQFTIAVAGCAVFLWLALRENPQLLHPMPTFAERLLQIAPYLTELAVGFAFLFWAIILLRQIQSKRTPPQPSNGPVGTTAKPRWTPRQIVAVGGYLAILFPVLGERFARFLWPLHARHISSFAALAALVLTLLEWLRGRQEKKRNEQSAPTPIGAQEESWFANDFVRSAFFFALTVGVLVCAHFMVRRYWPAHERIILPVIVAIATAVMIYLRQTSRGSTSGQSPSPHLPAHPRAARSPESAERRKKIWLGIYSTWLAALFVLPIPSQWKSAVFFGQVPVLLIYLVAVGRLRMWTYHVGHDGDTDRALSLNRRFAWIPGFGNSLEGVILFNAGRYREAQEFLKVSAFDSQGKPRLGTTELYIYSLALGNDGRLAEAQPFLEASIPVAKQPDGFRVALATNLLEQEKDPERARELLEQAIATPQRQSTAYGQHSDDAKRTARYAWALASCGRKADAQTQITQALVQAEGLRPADLAGVHYFVGESWKASGQNSNARTSFQEALRLAPGGVIGIAAKKGLAKLT
jgi:hypothetical protein